MQLSDKTNLKSAKPSKELVERRVRNRIIEYLEIVAGYEKRPPPWDLNETLNQWEDWVGVEHPVPVGNFSLRTYSHDEQNILVAVDTAWEAFCDTTPLTIVDEELERNKPEWRKFVAVVSAALEVFLLRGRLPEDE